MLVAEGIEDALTAYQATGLGAWAAGSASYMPALAKSIPSYIECLTILVDENAAGRTNSIELRDRLFTPLGRLKIHLIRSAPDAARSE
jgi:hypothetical protein